MPHNILLLTDNYPPQRGGMAQSCDRIVRGLRDRNNSIYIIHFIARKKNIVTQYQLNGTYTQIPYEEDEAHTAHLAWNSIKNNFNHIKLDHLLVFGGFVSLTAGPVFSKWLNLPLVVLFRGNDFDQAIFNSRKLPILDRAIEHAKSIGTVTEEMKQKITSLYPKKDVYFTPNSIDTNEWQPLKSDKIFVKNFGKKYKTESKIVIGIFGHLKPEKGIDFFIESLPKNLKDNIYLLLIGEIQNSTQKLLDAQQIETTIIPFMDRYELIKYYLCCDTVILPSFYDGMPNVLLEACALEIPVIASDVAGMYDVLHTIKPNLLFNTADRKACMEIVSQFYSLSKEQKKIIGKKQKERITNSFSQERELNSILELFK